ncbi:alpha/beta fold hydrolase [Novosphingobium sp.]|uniref:alpha/beta fold hydrolase n=1 Tax=Novosphingobium sp. TaxID=1874826 RepID=UPI002FE42856
MGADTFPTAYEDTGGDNPPVILIHGVGLSQAMWGAQKAALKHAYRVITLDMLGHGGSTAPAADAGLDDYADQVAALMDRLGVEKAILVGFSMGALVARAFALRFPGRLSGLVLLNGVFNRSEDVRATILGRVDEVRQAGPAANSEAAIERWFTPEFRAAEPGYIADLRAHMAGNDHHGYLTSYGLFASQDNFGADRLGEIAVPTLVATGEFDVGSTPEMTRELAARIPGAKAQVVADARHMMPVEMPEETNALLLGYLDTITQSPITAGEAS